MSDIKRPRGRPRKPPVPTSRRYVKLPPSIDDPLCRLSLDETRRLGRPVSINRLIKHAICLLLDAKNYRSTKNAAV